MKPDSLNGVYEELAQVIGVDKALQVYELYKGQQISFPVKLYSRKYIKEKIISEYTGANEKLLASKYGYSERWIREILRRIK